MVDEEPELNREQADMTEYQTKDLVTGFEARKTIAAEKRESTSHGNDHLLTRLVEDTIIKVLQVGYDSAKERVKPFLFNLVGEFIADIMQQRKMKSLLMKNIEALTKSDRYMKSLKRRVVEWQSLITPMMAYVKCHVNKIENDHHQAQRL